MADTIEWSPMWDDEDLLGFEAHIRDIGMVYRYITPLPDNDNAERQWCVWRITDSGPDITIASGYTTGSAIAESICEFIAANAARSE